MKRIFAISTTAALLLTGLTGVPAQAVTPGNCTTGSLTISSNVITSALGCSGEAVVPATMTSIGASAFEDETDIHTVTFEAGSNLTTIAAQAFAGSGVTGIAVPTTVTSIAAQAFARTAELTTVTFDAGSNLSSIGFEAFVSSGITAITIPASVATIDNSAFELTSDLASVTFESGSQLTSINQAAFQYSGLTSVEIPSGVTSVGLGAFYANSSLATVRIPATVTAIGASAFEATGSLTDVFFAGTSAPTVGADAFGDGGSPRASSPKANISYSARASFGLLGTSWNGLTIQYDEPAPAPAAIAIPAPTTSPAIDDRAEMTFAFKGSALTKKQRKNLKAMVSEVGRKGSFEITVRVSQREGESRSSAKASARAKGRLIKAYLLSRGVKSKNITISTELTALGSTPGVNISGIRP